MRMQIDLLRVLEDHIFYRVGGIQPIEADFRAIAASNKNLEQAINEKTFRNDLFYRLNVFSFEIYVPEDYQPGQRPQKARKSASIGCVPPTR